MVAVIHGFADNILTMYSSPRLITIGGKGKTRELKIGGNAPVSIQTMWKAPLTPDSLVYISKQMTELAMLGCDVVRFAVPDMESADLLVRLADMTDMPMVADIHFDHRLALRCLDGNVAKIRINPGNIGSKDKVREVVERARDANAAIRIGVNTGSLPADLRGRVEALSPRDEEFETIRAEALVEAAEREVAVFDELGFSSVVVSMKASSVTETVLCNEQFASRFDIPVHLGVTEAGPLIGGIVKSTLAFSRLFAQGIGSTVRVSLSDTVENEVVAARAILSECGQRKGGVTIVSCPRCGRDGFDVHGFVSRWQKELLSLNKAITVAVMGCVVNGPGEGKHADIGITGAGDYILIFRHGEIVRKESIGSDPSATDRVFREELDKV
jgi:(E)-4-hydroxy-3-methylbut-2-enyl-diphosphate synthase